MATTVGSCPDCGYEVRGRGGTCRRCKGALVTSPFEEMADGEPAVGFDLGEWEDADRGHLVEALIAAHLGHRFEGDQLVVGVSDVDEVDQLIAGLGVATRSGDAEDQVAEGEAGTTLAWPTVGDGVESVGGIDTAVGRVACGWPGATKLTGAARRLVGWEMLIVLAIFPLGFVWSALAALVERLETQQPIASQAIPPIGKPWIAVSLAVFLKLAQLAPVALVWYLLTRSGERLSAIHLDARRLRTDLALVLPVFIVAQWFPQQLGRQVVIWAHLNGFPFPSPAYFSNAAVTVSMVTAGVVAGIVEEVVVLGYLVRRLEQRGFGVVAIVAIAVAVRVSYHLYYGWNAIPILLWALATVLVYLRIRRLLPFIICHIAWDVAIPLRAFYGGAYHTLFFLSVATTAIMTVAWAGRSPGRGQPDDIKEALIEG